MIKFILKFVLSILFVFFVSSSAQHFEIENMSIRRTGALRGPAWALFSNGYVAEQVVFTSDSMYRFVLRASGSSALGEWPVVEMRIDQMPRASVTVEASAFAEFSANFRVSAGSHEVAVAFVNDFSNNAEDRNVYLDWLEIEIVGGGGGGEPQRVHNPVAFTWDPNTEPDLLGYRFYFGSSSSSYSYYIELDTNFYQANFPLNSTRFVAVTALDSAGNESGFSNEVSFMVESATVSVFYDFLYVEWSSPQVYSTGLPMARDGVLYYDLFCKDSLGVEVKLNASAVKQTSTDPISWAGEVKLSSGRYSLFVQAMGKDGESSRSAPVLFAIEKSEQLIPGAPGDVKVRVQRLSR